MEEEKEGHGKWETEAELQAGMLQCQVAEQGRVTATSEKEPWSLLRHQEGTERWKEGELGCSLSWDLLCLETIRSL